MKIFKLIADCNRYQNLVFTFEEDWAILDHFDGRNLLHHWTRPVVEILRDNKFNKNLPAGDFPNLFLPGVPVFSLRAVNALKAILEKNGELLPLSCVEGEYYAFNVTKLIDALDESKSELKRFKSGGGIMQIHKYVFFGEKLTDATIFKIPQFRRTVVYVSDKFQRTVLDNHLIGFKFVEVWEE
jgi:hypothetical protein